MGSAPFTLAQRPPLAPDGADRMCDLTDYSGLCDGGPVTRSERGDSVLWAQAGGGAHSLAGCQGGLAGPGGLALTDPLGEAWCCTPAACPGPSVGPSGR